MYAEIIVETKIPSIGKTYTYHIPEEIENLVKVGAVVQIPFGKTNKDGIIYSLSNIHPKYETKDLLQITDHIVVTEKQLELAKWISEKYLCNFNESVKSFKTLNLKIKTNQQKEIIPITKKFSSKKKLNLEQEEVMKSIIQKLKSPYNEKRFLLNGVTGSGKTEIYLQLSEKIINENKQILFLIPEISLTKQLLERFSERFGSQRIALINSRISRIKKNQEYKSILTGEKNIVIGSRSAVMSPFNNLGAIIIDECHDSSFRQEPSPTYNTIEVAKKLNEIFEAVLIIGSATPLIEQYHEALEGGYKLLELQTRISNTYPTNIVVNLKEEFNNNLISNTVKEYIKITLEKKEQTLIYINRRGITNTILCLKCGNYEKCPNCNISLTLHSKNSIKILICHGCLYKKDYLEKCSNCKSTFIKAQGIGTNGILNELKRIFPFAKIEVMDRETTSKKGSHEEILTRFINKEIEILIGTEMITKGWDIENINLTIYLLIELDMIFPSFRTREKVYQNIVQLSGRSSRKEKIGTNIIQTYNKSNQIINLALKNNYKKFYNSEIEIRKDTLYPPFYKLIRIRSKATNPKTALSKLELTSKSILVMLNDSPIKDNISMIGPSKSFAYKRNNEYSMEVIYKIFLDNKNQNFENFLKILSNVKKSSGVLINVDPYEII